jgi:hypothetical protein
VKQRLPNLAFGLHPLRVNTVRSIGTGNEKFLVCLDSESVGFRQVRRTFRRGTEECVDFFKALLGAEIRDPSPGDLDRLRSVTFLGEIGPASDPAWVNLIRVVEGPHSYNNRGLAANGIESLSKQPAKKEPSAALLNGEGSEATPSGKANGRG